MKKRCHLVIIFAFHFAAGITSNANPFQIYFPQICIPIPPKICPFQSKKKRNLTRETFLQTCHFEKSSFTKLLLVASQNTASGLTVHISHPCTIDSGYYCIPSI